MEPRAYKIQYFLMSLVLFELIVVLSSDITTPVYTRGHFFNHYETTFPFKFFMWSTFLAADIMAIYALYEKDRVKISYQACATGWMIMLFIQYCRIVSHEGLFQGLVLSISIWTILFTLMAIILGRIFTKSEIKKQEKAQEAYEREDLNKRVMKIGSDYYVQLGDEVIKVTKQELYNGDPNRL